MEEKVIEKNQSQKIAKKRAYTPPYADRVWKAY